MPGVLSTVEDMNTALTTIAPKSTGVGLSFWNKCFGKGYCPDSLKEMITSLDRQCTKSTEPVGFLLYGTDNCFIQGSVDGKAKQLHLAGRRKRPSKSRQVSFISEAEDL